MSIAHLPIACVLLSGSCRWFGRKFHGLSLWEINFLKKKYFPHFSDVLPFSLSSLMQFHESVLPGLGIKHAHLTDPTPITTECVDFHSAVHVGGISEQDYSAPLPSSVVSCLIQESGILSEETCALSHFWMGRHDLSRAFKSPGAMEEEVHESLCGEHPSRSMSQGSSSESPLLRHWIAP